MVCMWEIEEKFWKTGKRSGETCKKQKKRMVHGNCRTSGDDDVVKIWSMFSRPERLLS